MKLKCNSCKQVLELINNAFVCITKECNNFKKVQSKIKEEE